MLRKKSRYTRAVALKYEGNDGELPKVTAKGHHLQADQIVRLAKRYGVPVIEEPILAENLDRLPNNSSIPSRLYEAVAVLIHQIDTVLRFHG